MGKRCGQPAVYRTGVKAGVKAQPAGRPVRSKKDEKTLRGIVTPPAKTPFKKAGEEGFQEKVGGVFTLVRPPKSPRGQKGKGVPKSSRPCRGVQG